MAWPHLSVAAAGLVAVCLCHMPLCLSCFSCMAGSINACLPCSWHAGCLAGLLMASLWLQCCCTHACLMLACCSPHFLHHAVCVSCQPCHAILKAHAHFFIFASLWVVSGGEWWWWWDKAGTGGQGQGGRKGVEGLVVTIDCGGRPDQTGSWDTWWRLAPGERGQDSPLSAAGLCSLPLAMQLCAARWCSLHIPSISKTHFLAFPFLVCILFFFSLSVSLILYVSLPHLHAALYMPSLALPLFYFSSFTLCACVAFPLHTPFLSAFHMPAFLCFGKRHSSTCLWQQWHGRPGGGLAFPTSDSGSVLLKADLVQTFCCGLDSPLNLGRHGSGHILFGAVFCAGLLSEQTGRWTGNSVGQQPSVRQTDMFWAGRLFSLYTPPCSVF